MGGKFLRKTLRSRPWVLITTVALLPAAVTLLEMAGQLGGQTLIRLATDPSSLARFEQNPWLALLRPLVLPTLLLSLLVWLAVMAPESAVFRRQSLRIRRLAVAVLALLTAFSIWAGIILGDLAWHAALSPLPQTGASLALVTSPWLYGLAALLTAFVLYRLLRPAGRNG